MPPDPQKRQLRKLKRDVKRAGSKHRRRDLKKQLTDNPEEAHEAEENLGRHRSETMNQLDNDTTRNKEPKHD